ncbi:MAG: hypothetical protein V4586_20655 [Pseudomonadota bacterium]
MRDLKLALTLATCFILAGCVSSPAGNKLSIDNDGGGKFSGHAGMDWTQDELKKMVGTQVCGGSVPRNFDLKVMSGFWLFHGTC